MTDQPRNELPPTAPAPERSAILLDSLLIIAVGVILALILRPFQNTPVSDDFCFAWSVEHLLKTGELRLLEYTNNPNPVQVLWGALFCLPGGFSFTALRISTFSAGLMGIIGIYLLLIRLGASRRAAFIGAAVVGLNPIYFILQFSFMTDIHFIAWMILAAVMFVHAMEKRCTAAMMIAVALATLSAGVRVVSIVMPVAAVFTLLVAGGAWGRNWRRLVPWALPVIVLLGLMTWANKSGVRTVDLSNIEHAPAQRVATLKAYGLRMFPSMVLQAIVVGMAVLGPGLLPLAIGCLNRRIMMMAGFAGAGLIAVLWAQGWSIHPLESGNFWAWCELATVGRPNRPRQMPPIWLDIALGVLAVTSSAILAAVGIVGRSRDNPGSDRQAPCAAPRLRPGVLFVGLMILGHLLLIAFVWLTYDRFYLPVIALAVVFILARGTIRRPVWAYSAIGLLAAICLVGTRDHLAASQAMGDGLKLLEARGARPDEVDAGYDINGWRHYAHPEQAPRDGTGQRVVPSFTTNVPDFTPRYQLSDSPQEGARVIAEIPYRQFMARSGVVYVLEYLRPTARRR